MKNNIRTYREARNLTQEQVARAAGFTLRHFQFIEKGESIPTVYKALKIADILQVDIYTLFNYNQISN